MWYGQGVYSLNNKGDTLTKLMLLDRSASATYQWGGIARLDVVSAPLSTALVFYGPPALHVHAMPLLSQHDMIQSAAVLAPQQDSTQHGSAQHESKPFDSAQNKIAQNNLAQNNSPENGPAQHVRAQSNATQNSQNYSQQEDTSLHAALDTPSRAATADSEAFSQRKGDVSKDEVTSSKVSQYMDAHESAHMAQPPAQLQTVQDANATQHHTAAAPEDEEADGANEGLFGEASVLARGGLRMTEKVCSTLSKLHCYVFCMAILTSCSVWKARAIAAWGK